MHFLESLAMWLRIYLHSERWQNISLWTIEYRI